MGMNTSMPGQEGIPSVFSPMARTLEDLVYFSRSLIGMKPWLWDHSVHPIEWRTDEDRKVKETKQFKIGVMRIDSKTNSPGSVRPKSVLLTRYAGQRVILRLWTLCFQHSCPHLHQFHLHCDFLRPRENEDFFLAKR